MVSKYSDENVTRVGFHPMKATSRRSDSMNSCDSALGLVSSYRKTVSRWNPVTPAASSLSKAREKFMFMDLAWPMWR